MKQHTGIHFRVAFVRDSQLEYVPASERRWDLAGELEIRKGTKPRHSDMPGSKKIELGAGDACLFHAWGFTAALTEPMSRGGPWTLSMVGVGRAIIARLRQCVSPIKTYWHD